MTKVSSNILMTNTQQLLQSKKKKKNTQQLLVACVDKKNKMTFVHPHIKRITLLDFSIFSHCNQRHFHFAQNRIG